MILRIGSKKIEPQSERALQSSRAGFTLIEVLIATMITAVCLAGVFRAYTLLLNSVTVSQSYLTLVPLLKGKMAQMEQLHSAGTEISPGITQGIFPENPDFSWNLQISNAGAGDLAQLNLTVSDRIHKPFRELSLVTYVRKIR